VSKALAKSRDIIIIIILLLLLLLLFVGFQEAFGMMYCMMDITAAEVEPVGLKAN